MRRSQKERREQTTAAVLDIAQQHFARDGYSNVSTEAMVEQAGLTRGALYHHFGSKKGLFEAVLRRIQADIAAMIERKSAKGADAWESFLIGCFTWLESATRHETLRILLIDGPAVLGWQQWQAIDAEFGSRLLREGIRELVDEGTIHVDSIDALHQMLNGAMNEVALWVAQSKRPKQTLTEAKQTLEMLLNGLRNGTD